MPKERPQPPKLKYRVIIDVECRNPPAVETTQSIGTGLATVRTTGDTDGAALRVQVLDMSEKPEMDEPKK
jgi:hypothetical protein